ncbi:MAG: hypothetical protein WAR37_01415 [Candidatus Microsaccharimonas sp.]
MENEFEVEAEVHMYIGPAYRVKALVHDIGIYINGMMVFPPNDEHDWSVYPPLLGRAGRGKYRYTIEFNKQYPLWKEIQDACITAVKSHMKESGVSDFSVPAYRTLEEDNSPSGLISYHKPGESKFM